MPNKITLNSEQTPSFHDVTFSLTSRKRRTKTHYASTILKFIHWWEAAKLWELQPPVTMTQWLVSWQRARRAKVRSAEVRGGGHVLHRNTGVVNRNQGSAVGTSPHPCDCWGVVTVETVDLWAAEVTLSIISIIILFWLSNTQVKLKNCFQETWLTDSTNLLEPEVGSKRGLMDIFILLF